MKKGDERKQAIVEVAERLFFDKGYENTSVQDILDEMQLSKGGFYHHFESKQQLLEFICQQRAEASCQRGLEAAQAAGADPIARMNALFREGGFFGEEPIKYVSLMLATAYGGSLSQLRERTRQTTLEVFEPVLREILLDGMEQQLFYIAYPDSIARLIIMLAMDVTDEVAAIMARSDPYQGGEMAQMMELLGTYRSAVELMINAPHGSLELIDMRRIAEVLKALGLLARRSAY